MGWFTDLFLPKYETEEPKRASDETLGQVLTSYDLVEVMPSEKQNESPVVIVSPKALKESTSSPSTAEIGSSSASPFTSFTRREYNSELQGLKGLHKYDQMRRSDGTVRATLRTVKTPVLAARWFIEAASDSKRDQNAADFVWDCLTKHMSISWSQVLVEALLCADFGYYMFEKVWEERVIDGKKRMIWKKLAPRHPMDVAEWVYDAHGGPKGAWMYVMENASVSGGHVQQPNVMPDASQYIGGNPYNVVGTGNRQGQKYIPIDKLLVFTFDREAGNIEGISVLRSAYKHWYYIEQLYKIDAIQKERHGIGVPVIKLPVGFTKEDLAVAHSLGRNLRTNERAHIVLPPMWEISFAKLEGSPVDAMKSIEHHKGQIRENILANFLGNDKPTKEEDLSMFLKATRFIADVVCDTFNQYAIPQLMEYNFDRVGVPTLKARRIGEQADWRTLSFAIRNLIGAGVIRPDDRLEEYIREEMDLPKADVQTVRVVQTPQAAPGNPATQPNATPGTASGGVKPNGPGVDKQSTNDNKVGLPRQTPLPNVSTGQSNAGIDGSGGK